MIEEFIENKYKDVIDQIWIKEKDYGFVISSVVIKKEARNSGVGSKVMEDIIQYADNNNKIIALTPSTSYGSKIGRLTNFYKQFGFKNNKGSNKDFRFMETMIRYPKNMNESDKIKGGLADNKSVEDIAKKHDVSVDVINKAITKGVKIEMEHTSDKKIAKEIAIDHIFENPKYYEGLAKMEKSLDETKLIIKKLLKEKVDLIVTDETPDTISVLVEFNDRNAGIIVVTPSATDDKVLELVDMKFKEGYEELHIMQEALNGLWQLFNEINSIIVAPKPESIEFWNKMGFQRISPNYLISNRGH